MKKNTSSHSGFTLIEILIAIFVIGVGLLAVLSLFGLTISVVDRCHQTNQAYLVANQTIEQIRALPFSSLNNETTTDTITELPSGQITKTISPYQADNDLKNISVVVTWTSRGRAQSVEINSLATPRGINN